MHGLSFEDVNYAADGGLYAELVENRSFEHKTAMHGWRVEQRGSASGQQTFVTGEPIHPNNPRYLRMDVSAAGGGYGVSNLGYGGIPVLADRAYRFSIHARSPSTYKGGLKVCLEAADGSVLAEGVIDKLTSSWQRYPLALTAKATHPGARLVVLATAAGRVDIDMVSLFPKDTWKGRENGMRADLVQLLADMKPGFMRFPGGCIVEGKDLANAYRWKDTVGDVATRKQNWNRWQEANPKARAADYHQTYGLGFFEFFQLCEDIGAAPVPVINCGMACQYMTGQLVPVNELDLWVRDAVDLIEFANGPVTTKWGKLRAEMGHPKPFLMKHLAIGNEQWGDAYFERYAIFQRALKASHPEITLIATSGPDAGDQRWKDAWKKFRSDTPAEVVDEHHCQSLDWLLARSTRYDSYDRKGPKVSVGEFAAHRSDKANTLDAAVCEAAFMTGLLRNADVITMSSYASLLAREGFVQSAPDLIWFDATRVMTTPSYHVQSMFGRNRPDRVLPSSFGNNTAKSRASGLVGVGTFWSKADFKDIVVRNGDKILFQSKDTVEGWDLESGEWSAVDGIMTQSGTDKRAIALAGDPSWTDYTLTLKARNTFGKDGFVVLFHTVSDSERSWWQVGGWGNSSHAILMNGNVVSYTGGKIEQNRWYDLRVEVRGGEVKCYLDDKLTNHLKRQARPKVYAVAGIDQASNEIILHASNPSGDPQDLSVTLKGLKSGKGAQGEVLTSLIPDARNSLADLGSVVPEKVKVPITGEVLHHVLPPWSHTVLRVPQ